MLTIHHLEKSQSERMTWLWEELGVGYPLEGHAGDPATIRATPGLRRC